MKKIAILLIVLTVVSVDFLSGCNENNSSDNNQIQILNHKIETKYGTYSTGSTVGVGYYKEVSGTIKNIADKNIDKVTITVKFYDNDNEILVTRRDTVSNLANGETASFSVQYANTEPYYSQYHHYAISVST